MKWIFSLVIGLLPLDGYTAVITSLDFKVEGRESFLEIQTDEKLPYRSRQNRTDQQIVIDIPNSKIGPRAKRALDTSSFKSPVTLVNAYQVGDNGENVRVVVQMRSDSNAVFSQSDEKIRVRIGSVSEPETESEAVADESEELLPEEEIAQAEEVAPSTEGKTSEGEFEDEDLSEVEQAVDEETSDVLLAQPGEELDAETLARTVPSLKDPNLTTNQKIDAALANVKTKRFEGTPITLRVVDTDIKEVLRVIADASGFNIVVSGSINNALTLSLNQVPWDQVLDVVLTSSSLGAIRKNNVLVILTLAELTSRANQELQAKRAAETNAPRITKIFPISYAQLASLQGLVTQFGRSGSGSQTGTVAVDARTNSLIIQDIAENLDRMEKLIRILDTQTPQVLIEAKVIEASESFGRSVGIALGSSRFGTDVTNPRWDVSVNGGSSDNDTFDGLFGTAGESGSVVGRLAVGMGVFGSTEQLNAAISLAQADNQARIIASPRTVVLNQESATITQGTPVLIQTTQIVNGNAVTSTEQQSADLSLSVTPTVTNDESVSLTVNFSRSVPISLGSTGSGVGNRNISTKVLVESGSTLAMGGLYTASDSQSSEGFPFLKDIPIIGFLFGTKSRTQERTELFFFVSPRVLNTAEAGLSG